MTDEKVVQELWNSFPHCVGYPDCDGDLVGEEHSAKCPLFGKKEITFFEFARECHALGRRDGLEELAGNLWRYPDAPPIGKLRKGKRYDDRLYAIKKIRELASISSSANSVEGKKE